MKCFHCGYRWKSKSKLMWLTCPNCMQKFNRNGPSRMSVNRAFKNFIGISNK